MHAGVKRGRCLHIRQWRGHSDWLCCTRTLRWQWPHTSRALAKCNVITDKQMRFAFNRVHQHCLTRRWQDCRQASIWCRASAMCVYVMLLRPGDAPLGRLWRTLRRWWTSKGWASNFLVRHCDSAWKMKSGAAHGTCCSS
jgi:hypothetical protein